MINSGILISDKQLNVKLHDTPEKSEVVPSESMLRFSELSAVPTEASDSRVSSSDARGSRVSISKVNSSLQMQIQVKPCNVSTLMSSDYVCAVYFSFCRLSICSVSTLSSCCIAACWCSEISLNDSALSSSLFSSMTTSATDGSRGLTGGEAVL